MPRRQPVNRRSEEEEKKILEPRKRWPKPSCEPRVLEKPKNWLEKEAET